MSDQKLALTISEAAAALSVSRQTIWRWTRDDPTFPLFRIGRSVRISTEGLRQWVQQQTEEGMQL